MYASPGGLEHARQQSARKNSAKFLQAPRNERKMDLEARRAVQDMLIQGEETAGGSFPTFGLVQVLRKLLSSMGRRNKL